MAAGKYVSMDDNQAMPCRHRFSTFSKQQLDSISHLIMLLCTIGEKHQKHLAQVALNWVICKGAISVVGKLFFFCLFVAAGHLDANDTQVPESCLGVLLSLLALALAFLRFVCVCMLSTYHNASQADFNWFWQEITKVVYAPTGESMLGDAGLKSYD